MCLLQPFFDLPLFRGGKRLRFGPHHKQGACHKVIVCKLLFIKELDSADDPGRNTKIVKKFYEIALWKRNCVT